MREGVKSRGVGGTRREEKRTQSTSFSSKPFLISMNERAPSPVLSISLNTSRMRSAWYLLRGGGRGLAAMGATLSVWWLLRCSCVDCHTLKGAVVGKRKKVPRFVDAREARRLWGDPVWRAPFARRGVPTSGVGETEVEVKQKKKNGLRICEFWPEFGACRFSFFLGAIFFIFSSASAAEAAAVAACSRRVFLDQPFCDPHRFLFFFPPPSGFKAKQSKSTCSATATVRGVPLVQKWCVSY